MTASLGADWTEELRALASEAERLATEWHRSEPRVWSRALRFVYGGFGVVPAVRGFRAKASQGRERADAWLEDSVSTWRAQGRISAEQEARLRAEIEDPEFQAVLPHFGVHLMIGVALRFPFGSITRASYTAGNLLVATVRLALRRIDRRAWHRSARIHSPLVILIAAMPAVGTFAYVASGPVRSNHLLARVVFDSVGQKVPCKLYRRLGLRRLVAGKNVEVAG
jgi:hypothetical protein